MTRGVTLNHNADPRCGFDDDFAGLWHKADLYLYTCNMTGSPARVSRISIRLSPYSFSLLASGAVILILYGCIAYAVRKQDHTFISFIRALDPVTVTAGPDGKGSLSKFQALSFTLVVFGLFFLCMLQTGMTSTNNINDLTPPIDLNLRNGVF
jgi:hypothetical protein